MTTEEYYTAPPQEIFDEIKEKSIELWKTISAYKSYVNKKVDYIKSMENISDNAWTIVAMFDRNNQNKLLDMVSSKTSKMILNAMNT